MTAKTTTEGFCNELLAIKTAGLVHTRLACGCFLICLPAGAWLAWRVACGLWLALSSVLAWLPFWLRFSAYCVLSFLACLLILREFLFGFFSVVLNVRIFVFYFFFSSWFMCFLQRLVD